MREPVEPASRASLRPPEHGAGGARLLGEHQHPRSVAWSARASPGRRAPPAQADQLCLDERGRRGDRHEQPVVALAAGVRGAAATSECPRRNVQRRSSTSSPTTKSATSGSETYARSGLSTLPVCAAPALDVDNGRSRADVDSGTMMGGCRPALWIVLLRRRGGRRRRGLPPARRLGAAGAGAHRHRRRLPAVRARRARWTRRWRWSASWRRCSTRQPSGCPCGTSATNTRPLAVPVRRLRGLRHRRGGRSWPGGWSRRRSPGRQPSPWGDRRAAGRGRGDGGRPQGGHATPDREGVLEGESLVNDGTALVGLRPRPGRSPPACSLGWVAGTFLVAVGGGVLVGLLVDQGGHADPPLRRGPVLNTLVSLVTPFAAYLVAEEVHGSGVLAVVVAGVLLSQSAPVVQSAARGWRRRATGAPPSSSWRTRSSCSSGCRCRTSSSRPARSCPSARSVWLCAALLAVVLVSRFVWVYAGVAGVPRPGPYRRRRRLVLAGRHGHLVGRHARGGHARRGLRAARPDPSPGPAAAGGVHRGARLAAAAGPDPATLVRRLGLRGPDPAEDALRRAALLSEVVARRPATPQEVRADEDVPDDVADQLRARSRPPLRRRLGAARPAPTRSTSRRRPGTRASGWRCLPVERSVLLRARDAGRYDEEVMRSVLDDARRRGVAAGPRGPGEPGPSRCALRPGRTRTQLREHLRSARGDVTRPDAGGLRRLPASRGRRGCTCGCAWPAGRWAAATARRGSTRAATSRPPGTRSCAAIEPGEAWRWCFVDDQLG